MRWSFKENFRSIELELESICMEINLLDKDARSRIETAQKLFEERIRRATRHAKKIHNPFLLTASSLKGISDESEILKMKQLSGLETSIGKIIEDLLRLYGWNKIESESHTTLSEIDHMKDCGPYKTLLCLKSGPNCLNDTTACGIGNAIVDNFEAWLDIFNTKNIRFIVALNYATYRNCNKKNWHTIRLCEEQLAAKGYSITRSCKDGRIAKPLLLATKNDSKLVVKTLCGVDLWKEVGNPHCDAFVEIVTMLSKIYHSTGTSAKDCVRKVISCFADIVK